MASKKSNEQLSFREHFDYVGSVLDILGLNFVRNDWKSTKTHLISLSVLLAYVLNANAGLSSLDDYQEVIYAVIAITSGFIGVPKVYTILKYHKLLKSLKDTVVQETSYSIHDCLHVTKLKIKYSNLAGKVKKIFTLCYGCGGGACMIFPVFVKSSWMLPVSAKIPGISNTSHPGYDIHYILMVLFVFYALILYLGYDVSFFYYVAYIAFKIDVCVYYTSMLGDFDSEFNTKLKQTRLFNKILHLHVETFRFINNCSTIFSAVVCFQPFAAMLMMTVCLFNVHVNPYNWSYACLMSVTAQFFIYCYCGELVISKVQEISRHLYCSQWYNISEHGNKFIFLLMNSQRDMSFSAYGLYDLSFATFVRLLKATFGYVTFLQNVL